VDDPTLGEIGRRLAEMASDVRDLPGRAEYTSDRRGLDYRFSELGRDLEDIRKRHAADFQEINRRISAELKEAIAKRQSWRQIIYTGLIPALVALLAILAQIWLRSGGK